ncbi:hypothetical protein ACQJBY_071503 [Aegilops geniculata]
MAASSSSSHRPCPKCLRWSPSSLAAELGTTSASGKMIHAGWAMPVHEIHRDVPAGADSSWPVAAVCAAGCITPLPSTRPAVRSSPAETKTRAQLRRRRTGGDSACPCKQPATAAAVHCCPRGASMLLH